MSLFLDDTYAKEVGKGINYSKIFNKQVAALDGIAYINDANPNQYKIYAVSADVYIIEYTGTKVNGICDIAIISTPTIIRIGENVIKVYK